MSQVQLRQIQPSSPSPSVVRPSRRGKWRALVLGLLTLLFVGHYVQWRLMGRTITPIEPSEAMQTLEVGLVNAGFIFFTVSILTTMVFGRFFCGWACHIVALQDLCGAMLKRVGIRPKPFRSRLLVFVPLFAAFYMFVWPQVLRLWAGDAFPALKAHLVTDDFWASFPGPAIALLTFGVCGFLIVYLLGNKGFCTYGCPYGAIFYQADKIAPGKIRVTEDCDQCGHCTATCTSNVRVNEEVKLYGMVSDPGCMKCMDCVDVCPKGALYYGFGKPEVSKGKPRAEKPKKTYDFTWPEELAMGLTFAVAFYAFRGLYSAVPFLLSVGLASITAFLLLVGLRLIYSPAVRLQRAQLKDHSKVRPAGWAYATGCAALAIAIVHSVFIQVHAHEGERSLQLAQGLFDGGLGTTEAAIVAANRARGHFSWANEHGLFPVAEWKGKLGAVASYEGAFDIAATYLTESLRLDPSKYGVATSLAKVYDASGRRDDAIKTWLQVYRLNPSHANALEAGTRLIAAGRSAEALPILEKAAQHGDGALLKALAKAQLDAGKRDDALKTLGRVLEADPNDASAHYATAIALGKAEEQAALAHLRKATRVKRDFLPAWILLGQIELGRKRFPEATRALEEARALSPFNPQILKGWAESHRQGGTLKPTLYRLIRSEASDDAGWYAAAMLYAESGQHAQSRVIIERLRRRNPSIGKQ